MNDFIDLFYREDLGKGINTDEAAALGAVYQAAHLGKGFKVKKFAIKDAVLFPISVSYSQVNSGTQILNSFYFEFAGREIYLNQFDDLL